MANPIKLRSDNHLQEMTNAEMDYAVYRVLLSFASTTTLSINPGNTSGLTNIGNFVDTIRNDSVGTHPTSGATSSTTYTFYQNRQTQSEASMSRPLGLTSDNMSQQSNTDLNNTIISRALSQMINDGIGKYQLRASAPSGGTWTNRGTITNSVRGASSSTFTLWQKTNASAPTTIRPIRLDGSNDLREMSNADIETLVARLRNRINETGIGRYALQTTAPATGTWVAAGNSFQDTRRQVQSVNYTGSYAGNYAGSRQRFWFGSFGGTFYGSYSGFRNRTYAGNTIMSGTENASNAKTLWIRTA